MGGVSFFSDTFLDGVRAFCFLLLLFRREPVFKGIRNGRNENYLFFPGETGGEGTWQSRNLRHFYSSCELGDGRIRVTFSSFLHPKPKVFLKLPTFRSKWASFSFGPLSPLGSPSPSLDPAGYKKLWWGVSAICHITPAPIISHHARQRNRGLIGWESEGDTAIFKAFFSPQGSLCVRHEWKCMPRTFSKLWNWSRSRFRTCCDCLVDREKSPLKQTWLPHCFHFPSVQPNT